MKITNRMAYSIVVAGKEIKAGHTESIQDKKWEEASQSRVISSLLEKGRLFAEESKVKKKQEKAHEQKPVEEKTEEPSFEDERKSFYGL